MAGNTVEGSRVVAWLRVGDYLNEDKSQLFSACRSARTYRWIAKLASVLKARVEKAAVRYKLADSIGGSRLVQYLNLNRIVLNRRGILFFLVVFLIAFYSCRFMLLKLFPGSEYYVPPSSGLVLAVLLGMLLVQLRPGGERPDDSGRGILESAAYFYRLAAGRIKRSDKKPKVQSTLEAGSLGARIEKDFNRGGSGESIDPEG
ncbi:MAG: hypothetical protein DRG82_17210 [Deltaproteobacteria bacterium]|nr:MAG: hypothetical protein DRG82_17210 [Deltaproteobacteria bacterium]